MTASAGSSAVALNRRVVFHRWKWIIIMVQHPLPLQILQRLAEALSVHFQRFPTRQENGPIWLLHAAPQLVRNRAGPSLATCLFANPPPASSEHAHSFQRSAPITCR